MTPGGGGDTLAHMKRLLCVFAHPDDECLGPGGSIAQCAIDGGEVFITTFTAGEAGSIGISKTLAREVAADGITCNVVIPGRVATDRIRFLDDAKATREGRTVESIVAESTAAAAKM